MASLAQQESESLSQNVRRRSAELCGERRRVAEMEEFLNSHSGILFEFDDKLVRRIVDKATVYDSRLTVEFKTGTEVSVEI